MIDNVIEHYAFRNDEPVVLYSSSNCVIPKELYTKRCNKTVWGKITLL